jgi:hypothetical protein
MEKLMLHTRLQIAAYAHTEVRSETPTVTPSTAAKTPLAPRVPVRMTSL